MRIYQGGGENILVLQCNFLHCFTIYLCCYKYFNQLLLSFQKKKFSGFCHRLARLSVPVHLPRSSPSSKTFRKKFCFLRRNGIHRAGIQSQEVGFRNDQELARLGVGEQRDIRIRGMPVVKFHKP